jgi:hypothetical protein
VGLLGRLRSHGDIEDGAPSHSFEDQTGLRLELDPELSARLRQAAERRGRHPQALAHDLLTDGLEGGGPPPGGAACAAVRPRPPSTSLHRASSRSPS